MKKTVLIYNDRAICGGSEVVMKSVAEYLAKQDCRVIVTTDETDTKTFYSAYSPEIQYYPRSLPYRPYKRYSLRWFVQGVIRHFYEDLIVPILDRRRYDVAVAFKDGPCTKRISRSRAKKKVAWVHTDFSNFHWTKSFFDSDEAERQCFREFDHVICVSDACLESVKDTVGDPGNLVTAWNPIDYRAVLEKAEEPPERKKEKFLFVSVGRLAGAKQFDYLLSACKNLQGRYDFETWIIGDGPEAEKLKRRAESEQIFSVKLLGERKNPFPLLKQADCYVCSSKSESYCIAIQEALILGVPVISTYFPALVEGLNPRFGILADNSEAALEAAMESVLRDPSRLQVWREQISGEYDREELWQPRLQAIRDILLSR